MMYPLVKELAGDGIPVAVTCRVLKLARQPYYRWLAAPVTAHDLDEAYLANVLFDAQEGPARTGPSRPARIHGPGRIGRGQRGHGELLLAAAEERSGPRRWATRAELRLAIITWIERTYHRRRRQARLGRLTPIEFEAIMTTQVALAA